MCIARVNENKIKYVTEKKHTGVRPYNESKLGNRNVSQRKKWENRPCTMPHASDVDFQFLFFIFLYVKPVVDDMNG